MSSSSLNQLVNWMALYPVLGVKPLSSCLPAVTECPLCRSSRATIFHDFSNNGQWHTCKNCQFFGDMIELAAAHFKLDLTATVLKLQSIGCLDDTLVDYRAIQFYISDWPTRRKFINDMLDRGSLRLSGDVSKWLDLLRHLGIKMTQLDGKTLDNSASLLSLLVPSDLNDHETRFAEDLPIDASGRSRQARNWKYMVGLPYYTMPGYCVGLQLLNADCRKSLNNAYKTLLTDRKDPGLYVHRAAMSSAGLYDNTVLGMPNSLHVLKLQLKHMVSESSPLPLVAWRDDPMRYTQPGSWHMARASKIVIWTPEPTIEQLYHAILSDGSVSLNYIKNPDAYFADRPAHESFSHLTSNTIPWYDAVAKYLATADDAKLEEFLRKAKRYGLTPEHLFRSCSQKLVDRCYGVLEEPNKRVCVSGTKVVRATESGWYYKGVVGEEVLLTDAVPHIDKIITYPNSKKTYYEGRVTRKGKSVKFSMPREELEDDPKKIVRNLCVDNGLGLPLMTTEWREIDVVSVSSLFGEPELVVGADRVGWDSSTQTIVLPKVLLTPKGPVANTVRVFGNRLPGETYRLREISPNEFADITEAVDENKLAWAMLAYTAAQVLAPVFGEKQTNLVLEDRAVPDAFLSSFGLLDDLKDNNHDLPVYLSDVSEMDNKLIHRTDWRRIICSESPYRVSAMMCRRVWSSIEIDECTPDEELGAKMADILVAYLADIAKRKYTLNQSDNFLLSVVADIDDWIKRCTFDKQCLPNLSECLKANTAQNAIASWLSAIFAKIERGNVDVETVGSEADMQNPLSVHIMQDCDEVFVPKAWYSKTEKGIKGGGYSSLYPEAEVTTTLRDGGVATRLKHNEEGMMIGWILPLSWWSKELRKFKTKGRRH